MATRPPASAVSTTATAITAKESEALLKFRQLAESNLKVIHKNQEVRRLTATIGEVLLLSHTTTQRTKYIRGLLILLPYAPL